MNWPSTSTASFSPATRVDVTRKPCGDAVNTWVVSRVWPRADGADISRSANTGSNRALDDFIEVSLVGVEEALRTRLFSRSPRGYALTNAGHELLPYATAMDEQAAAARRKLAARDEALVGVARVSAIDDVAGILSPIVASFRAKHPGVSVTVDMRSPERVAFRSQSFLARLAAVRDGVGIGVLGWLHG